MCEKIPALQEDPARGIAAWMYPLAVFQMFSSLFLIFVSFSKSPLLAIKDKYEKYVPFVHAALAVLIFLVIPTIIVIATFTNFGPIR
jgi:hypothetical protein